MTGLQSVILRNAIPGRFAIRASANAIVGLELALMNLVTNLDDDLFGHQTVPRWSDHTEGAKFNGGYAIPTR